MKTSNKYPITVPIVVLVGPTAIGKTSLSIQLARQFDLEVVSVDSMQVYRYMDIGTAKIQSEEMQGVRHHLLDVVDPDEDFSTGQFEKLAVAAIEGIISRGKGVLLTGGTGLYLRAVLSGLSKELPNFPEIRKKFQQKLAESSPEVLHELLSAIDGVSGKRLHPNDTQRVVRALEIYEGTGKPWSEHIHEHQETSELRFANVLKIGLTCDRQLLYRQIEKRSRIMLNAGLEEEVAGLLAAGYNSELKAMRSIGYKHMANYLSGEWGQEEMVRLLVRDTRRYAKRQYTWFRKESDLKWLDKSEEKRAFTLVSTFVDSL